MERELHTHTYTHTHTHTHARARANIESSAIRHMASKRTEMDGEKFQESFQKYVNQGMDPSGAAAKALMDMTSNVPPSVDVSSIAASKTSREMSRSVIDEEYETLKSSMFPTSATVDDIRRWYHQGFVWSDYARRRFGLLQSQGGPCGVLAAVQAFVLLELLFKNDRVKDQWEKIEGDQILDSERESALIEALVSILAASREDKKSPFHIVTLADDNTPLDFESPGSMMILRSFDSQNECKRYIRDNMNAYHSRSGVCLFVFSLLLTRGVDTVKGDMDEPMPVTARHGHCTQELLNLALTGRATSQVFDGSKPVGDTGLVLQGIDRRPRIGLLSYLEALRYLEVGSFYKNPSAPLFVIGATGHFSVLFCLDVSLVSQSVEERVYKAIRRAFSVFDKHDNGFIPVSDIDKFLDTTVSMAASSDDSRDEDPVACFVMALNTPTQRAKLRAACDPEGMGICLWTKFWSTCKRIVAASQTTVVDGTSVSAPRQWEAQCRRAFDALDHDSTSFIRRENLGTLLKNLPLPIQSIDPNVAINEIDRDGLGIILWPNFWTFAQRYPAFSNGVGGGTENATISMSRTFRMFHYNGLRRVVQGEDRGPSLVEFDLETVPPGQIGGSLPDKAPKIEKVLRTKFQGAVARWRGVEPPSIDG